MTSSLNRIAVMLPVVVGFLTASLILGLWWTHTRREQMVDRERLDLIADQIKNSVEQGLRSRLGLIKLLRDQWSDDTTPERRDFTAWCTPILAEFPGFQAVNWVDNQGRVQWVYPPETNTDAIGFDINRHPVAGPVWRRAKITRTYTVTPAIELVQSGVGFAVYFPVSFRDGGGGFLNLVFRTRPLIETCLGKAEYTAYDFRLTNNDRELYATRPDLPRLLPDQTTRTLELRGNTWHLAVGHNAAHPPSFTRRPSNVLLFVGLLMVLLFSFSLRVILARQVSAREQERATATLMENLPGMVYRYDLRTPYSLSFVSQGAFILTGWRDNELTENRAAGYRDLVLEEFRPALEKVRLTACKTQSAAETIYRIRTRSGISRWVWDRTCPIFDNRGNILAMEGFATDVSERIEAEHELLRHHNRLEEIVAQRTAELKRTNDELLHEIQQRRRIEEHLNQSLNDLARANRDLEEFAYVTSHDLKAPLRGIHSMAQWLAEDYGDRLDQTGAGYVATIGERATRLTQLIDGILAYSRAGAGSEKRSTDSAAVLASVLRNLNLPPNTTVHQEGHFPEVLVDPTQLFQIFQNLIGNAAKHMNKPGGCITVFADENHQNWLFGVADDGVGIPEDQQERIFKLFQTLKEGDRNQGDTGIGLALVKKIIEANGGFIQLTSKPGEGARFTFSIPKESPAAPVIPSQ